MQVATELHSAIRLHGVVLRHRDVFTLGCYVECTAILDMVAKEIFVLRVWNRTPAVQARKQSLC